MTSTEFTVGVNGGRISSRVLRPPGGGSSDIFGLGSYSSTNGTKEPAGKQTTQNRLFGGTDVQNPAPVPSTPSKPNIISNNVTVTNSAKKAYVRRNPITGEGFEIKEDSNEKAAEVEEKDECDTIVIEENGNKEVGELTEETKTEMPPPAQPKQVVTSIRVRNPPGGKSSGIFF